MTEKHLSPEVVGHIDTELERLANEFDLARNERLAETERLRQRRARRITHQFQFLFALLVALFLLLAYRTEVNARALHEAQVAGCERRVVQAENSNQGRLALINVVTSTPSNAALSPAEKAQIVQQLKDGLNLPIEDCAAIDQ